MALNSLLCADVPLRTYTLTPIYFGPPCIMSGSLTVDLPISWPVILLATCVSSMHSARDSTWRCVRYGQYGQLVSSCFDGLPTSRWKTTAVANGVPDSASSAVSTVDIAKEVSSRTPPRISRSVLSLAKAELKCRIISCDSHSKRIARFH